jgi:hypothetical protein
MDLRGDVAKGKHAQKMLLLVNHRHAPDLMTRHDST